MYHLELSSLKSTNNYGFIPAKSISFSKMFLDFTTVLPDVDWIFQKRVIFEKNFTKSLKTQHQKDFKPESFI